MKQNIFNKLWLRVAMIVAVVTTAFAGTVWAEDEDNTITVELEGFTATSGQIDGNISYLTSDDGLVSDLPLTGDNGTVFKNNLSATTFTLKAANKAKINSVTFHWTVGWSQIACVPSTGATQYFVANINEQDKQYPTVSGFNCNEISFSHQYSGGLNPSFDYISVTYTPGDPDTDKTITALSSDENKGTVERKGNVIIAKPKPGYGVADDVDGVINSYTITSGTADVVRTGNNFVVKPSAICTVKINFVAHMGDSSIDFEHDLGSYTDWENGETISRSTWDQRNKAHGGTGYFGKPKANTAWIKTVNKVAYPGTFTCYVRKIENQSSLTWKIQVSSNGSSGWTDVNSYSPAGSTGTDWEKFSADLSQHTNVYVRLYYTGNGTAGAIDDIVLTTATATVPVTVSEYGYSTFCCHRALDFTNSNINVYYATAEGTTLTFHKITQLPPDTGVLLQKAGGTTEEVPAYVGTTLTKPSGNVFVPGTDNVVTWTENDMNYILYHGAFYQADENRVATNRAYIHLPVTANPVKSFEINLDDPTGIEAIENGQLTIDNEIYNLAGQRLSKMQKGINIVNGKKILF